MSEPVDDKAKKDDVMGMLEEIQDHLEELRDVQPAVHRALDDALHRGLEPLIQLLLAMTRRQAQSASGQPPRKKVGATVHLDLRQNDEATRQLLYCLVVKDHFLPLELEEAGEIWVPLVKAEECDLKVYWNDGRWFISWLKLDEPEEKPEGERRALLLLEQDPPGEGPLRYKEV